MSNSSNSGSLDFGGILTGNSTVNDVAKTSGITTEAFLQNLAVSFGIFVIEITLFLVLRSSGIGRRIFQPKTYLVQERLRVEPSPANPWKWLRRIFTIQGEELKAKCGLDGYFFIRFIRAMILIFVPLMVLLVSILVPINYHGGKNAIVKGLDRLSWQNVAPDKSHLFWAHLVCAIVAISWTLFRIYREKLHYITTRQIYLTSPEHRLRASARTILVTNIPREYRDSDALKALYDVFVDNDDRSKLHVWINRDYAPLRQKVFRLRSMRHALEKAELKFLRTMNKRERKNGEKPADDFPDDRRPATATSKAESELTDEVAAAEKYITAAFNADREETEQREKTIESLPKQAVISLVEDGNDWWKPAPKFSFRARGVKVPKVVWLRAEIAKTTAEVEEMLRDLDNETRFPRQNSAFVQFDRQMAANMACALVSHENPGCMSPRFLDVAPHEVIWRNMGLTSRDRLIRGCIAILLFAGMLILWAIPAAFLGILSQLSALAKSVSWLAWMKNWPSGAIGFISGPVTSILLTLLVQLVVPALCRKLAILVGSPTRSRREIVTQRFYFTFLFIELVLLTSISGSVVWTITSIFNNPTSIANTLATDLPKAANYFFNYLIIQALGFSGSVLCQYLRLLYITTIWPWFTQTPRQEVWLQTTIPHQMWGNVYPMFTNFAAIGLLYCIISPLVLIFASAIFCLFWIAYRSNYWYVQRVKVDSHGMLFNNALSQLMSGVYVLEFALICLFFLARNDIGNAACVPQAVIMIVVMILTAAYHYVLDSAVIPLQEFIPVTREDKAVTAERKRFGARKRSTGGSVTEGEDVGTSSGFEKSDSETHVSSGMQSGDQDEDLKLAAHQSHVKEYSSVSKAAADARKTFSRLNKTVMAKLTIDQANRAARNGTSRKREVADQLAASIAGYPDELTRLTAHEREAELSTAYQDPITREPAPVIWIPQDVAGYSEKMIHDSLKYGKYLQYSNTGAYLARNNKCEVTQPAPDAPPDWMLDWSL